MISKKKKETKKCTCKVRDCGGREKGCGGSTRTRGPKSCS